MSDINIKNSDLRGSHVGDTIYNAQRNEDVGKLLAALTTQVETLAAQLPAQKAQQVRSDLEVLKNEAASPEPRRRMFDVTGEGLIDAAKTVATMAPSITAAVMEIGRLLFP